MIRVLIAEDQAMVRGALASLLALEDDIDVVAEVDRGDAVLAAARTHLVDVALLDIEMPGQDGISACAELARELPGTRTLILTTFGRPGYLRRAIENGADGFLLKDAPADRLAEAVREVNAGRRVIDPGLAAAAIADGVSPLTEREQEVLAAATKWATAAEIAAELYLSEGTVRNYLSAAIGKLGARNRAEAIRIAEEKGWLWRLGIATTRLKRGSIMSTAETPQNIGATQMADTERQTAGGKVLWHFTMSLDGFVAGPNHAMDWMTGTSFRPGLIEEYAETTGAVLGGRDGFDAYPDVSVIYGGAWQGPVFVLTHHPEDAQPAKGVTFLRCDVAEAVRIGLEAADGKNLEVFSATIGRQLLERGLIDEIDLHIAPVLLGDGIRLFDNPGGAPVRLELLNGDDPTAAVNVRYHPVATG